jgi:hypothetical protein
MGVPVITVAKILGTCHAQSANNPEIVTIPSAALPGLAAPDAEAAAATSTGPKVIPIPTMNMRV